MNWRSPASIDALIGKKFSNLTVIKWVKKDWKRYALCICDCGEECVKRFDHIHSGRIKSCGCSRPSKTHGMSHSPEYTSWECMIQRCRPGSATNLRNSDIYRMISVCIRWKKFENFFRDMGPRPDGTTLDRIDNLKGYFPGNCRWATWAVQARNKRKRRTRAQLLGSVK